MDHQFRNATLGGFNKQDVLDYLELITKEHAAQTQSLQEQLDQALAQCSELNEQATQQSSQVQQLSQENQQLQQTVAQLQEQLNRAQADASTLRTQLSQKEQERIALQQQVDKLAPDATAYAAVKDRTAGMELDAHRRAQGVLDQAQEEAAQLQAQMLQWLSKVNRQYSDLRSQLDCAVSHAAGELTKAEALLEEVTRSMEEQDSALESLEQTFGKCEPLNKVPAPMPIPET